LAGLLERPAPEAAPGVLGCRLTAGEVTVRITEVEAYAGLSADPASHAHRGQTARNTAMFGPPGTAYVYFTYGMHWCLNVTCEPPGRPSALLVRAGEVVAGIEAARARRPGVRDRDLARGPARLTTALGIGRESDGTCLLDGSGPVLLTAAGPVPAGSVRCGPRVGVSSAAETPWRFWIDGEPSVSVYRPHVPRRRAGPA
jgi:DNA-3-methyladenine glycosylase